VSEERVVGSERGRWSSRRKTEVVLRALRGEDLDALSRELGVTAGTVAQWREQFLASGQAGLKSRPGDERDDEVGRLLRDPALSARMGAAGRRRAEARFSLRLQVDRLLALWSTVTKEESAA